MAGELPLQTSLPPLAQLLASETAGWRELGPMWGQPLAGEDPCTSALGQGLQCFRTARMTPHGLRQLDRPAILTLRLPDGAARVLITRLEGDAVILQAGERRWRVALLTLVGAWRGDYATLWRAPPGSSGRVGTASTGAAAQWLDQQLTRLQTAGQLSIQAASATARLQAFQQAHGIDGGGKVTATTYMQVNRLSGVTEPRLITTP